MLGRLIVRKRNKGMRIMAIPPPLIQRVGKKAHKVNFHQKKNPKNLQLKMFSTSNKKIPKSIKMLTIWTPLSEIIIYAR